MQTARDYELLSELLEASHHLPPDDLSEEVRRLAAARGLADVAIYVADYSQRYLVSLGRGAERLEIDTTLAGRAFRTTHRVMGSAEGTGHRVWVPIIDGRDRIGVMEVVVPDTEEPTLTLARHLAGLVALLIVSKISYGDGLRLRRQGDPFSLAAQLRWGCVPPLTVTVPGLTMSGMLEPVHRVAGDSFDYAINGPTAHFALFDAVGHGLDSARIADLAMAAYRNLRPQHDDLEAIYAGIDTVLTRETRAGQFVTAQLAQLDVPTGRLRLLNAGHPAPILLRQGRTHDLAVAPNPPMGLSMAAREPTFVHFLEPGDSALFFTDGMTDARSADGELFGRQRLADAFAVASQSGESAPELVRRLVGSVLGHATGVLRDDASVFLVRWEPPDGV